MQEQSWSSVVAPKGTPKEIVDKISADIAKIVRIPEFRQRLTAQGAVFVGSTPEELDAFLKGEHEKYGPLIKSIGLRAN